MSERMHSPRKKVQGFAVLAVLPFRVEKGAALLEARADSIHVHAAAAAAAAAADRSLAVYRCAAPFFGGPRSVNNTPPLKLVHLRGTLVQIFFSSL